jgi:signal transduction histidine kinase
LLEMDKSISDSHVHAVFDHTRDLILSVDREYRILTINKSAIESFEGSFGITPKPGDLILDLIVPELVTVWKERYDQAFNGNYLEIPEHYKTDSDEQFFLLSIYPIREQGEINSVSIISRDVTVIELQKRQITSREVELKELTARQSQLIENIKSYTFLASHNLRGPITNIMGLVKMLRESQLDKSEVVKSLELIDEEISDLDEIVRELNEKLRETDSEN